MSTSANRPDPFCEWYRLWEERSWRAFVLASTALALGTAVTVAVQHFDLLFRYRESPAAAAAPTAGTAFHDFPSPRSLP